MNDNDLKRWTQVTVDSFEAKVVNPIYEKGRLIAYRLTDGKRPAFWMVVPAYLVKEKL